MNKILICSTDDGRLKWTAGVIRLFGFRSEGYRIKINRKGSSSYGYVFIDDDAEAVLFKLTRL